MIKPKTKQLASDETTPVPKFQFSSYQVNKLYHNDNDVIDFVTNGKSLYVCIVDGTVTSHANIEDESGFLKLVSQGAQGDPGVRGDDGRPGNTPNLTFKFVDKQLLISENGVIRAASPDLAGPAWRPVLRGDNLDWELSKDKTVPQSIDLHDLTAPERPILLRTNSDNTKRDDEESGPANFIQWKYEGDAEWTNLISISELLNLALAGVSFWPDNDGYWHFGHKEVIRATYASDDSGHDIISDVELGDVLFDAGQIPFANYSLDIDAIKDRLTALENKPDVDLSNYYTKSQADGKFQPIGNYLVSHQPLKTINGNSLIGNGNINIETIPDLTGYATQDWVNGKLGGFVKTINNMSPDANGNINISVSGTGILNLKIQNNKLYKQIDNTDNWYLVGSVGGGGEGGSCAECWTEEDILGLIANALTGYLTKTEANNTYVKIADKTQVSWTQIYNGTSDTRTKIATVTINGVTTDVYAPKNTGEGGGSGDGISYRTFMVYQRTSSPTVAPTTTTITGAVWNDSTNELDLTSSVWTNHPENASGANKYLWMTSGAFDSETRGLVGDWEDPICLTGEDGEGVDGKGVEFIYHLGNTTAPTFTWTKAKKWNETRDVTIGFWETYESEDWVPGSGVANDYWTDNPSGISNVSENTKIEWASVRKSYYDVIDNVMKWGDFSSPFIWSRWGEDGVDGDGVEYVFLRTDVDGVDIAASGQITLKSAITRPDNSWAYDSPVAPWTDEPSGVTETYKYEFVSIRKTVLVNGEKVWGNWSEPALWAKYGEKGDQGDASQVPGPMGDTYEYIYVLSGTSMPETKLIDESNEDSDHRTRQDDGYLPRVYFDGNLVNPSLVSHERLDISAEHIFRFVASRRKHLDVWGSFTGLRLDANYVTPALTTEQLNEIKTYAAGEAQQSAGQAMTRVQTLEQKLAGQTAFAEHDIDGLEAKVKTWAGSVTEEGLVDAGILVDGVGGKVSSWATFTNGVVVDGVDHNLSAIEGRITSSATAIDTLSADVHDSRIIIDALEGNMSLVSKNTYATNSNGELLDSNNHVVGTFEQLCEDKVGEIIKNGLNGASGEFIVKCYLDPNTNEYVPLYHYIISRNGCTYTTSGSDGWYNSSAQALTNIIEDADGNYYYVTTHNGSTVNVPIESGFYLCQLNADAVSAIRQKVNQIDLSVQAGDSYAAIVERINADNSSEISLDADKINLRGETNATKAIIGHATIADSDLTRCNISGVMRSVTGSDQQGNPTYMAANTTDKSGFYFDSTGAYNVVDTSRLNRICNDGITLSTGTLIVGNGSSNETLENYIDRKTAQVSDIVLNLSNDYQKVQVYSYNNSYKVKYHQVTGTDLVLYKGTSVVPIISVEYDNNGTWTAINTTSSGLIYGGALTKNGTNSRVVFDLEKDAAFGGVNIKLRVGGIDPSDNTHTIYGYSDWIFEVTTDDIYNIVTGGITQLIFDDNEEIINPYNGASTANTYHITEYDLESDIFGGPVLPKDAYVLFFKWNDEVTYHSFELNQDDEFKITFKSTGSIVSGDLLIHKHAEAGDTISGWADGNHRAYTVYAYVAKYDQGGGKLTNWSDYSSTGVLFDYETTPIIRNGSTYSLECNYSVIPMASNGYTSSLADSITAGVYQNGTLVTDAVVIGVAHYAYSRDGAIAYSNINNPFTSTNGLLTISSSDIDNDSSGDCLKKLEITATYNNTNLHTTLGVVYNGNNGENAVPYVYRGEWDSISTYTKNDQQIDVVKWSDVWYMCADDDNIGNEPGTDDGEYWTPFRANFENVATGVIFANTGYITELKVDSADITGTLTADELQTLNGDGKGVLISNNEINAYSTGRKNCLRITGDDLVPNSSSTAYLINGVINNDKLHAWSGNSNTPVQYIDLCTFNYSGQNNIQISQLGFEFNVDSRSTSGVWRLVLRRYLGDSSFSDTDLETHLFTSSELDGQTHNFTTNILGHNLSGYLAGVYVLSIKLEINFPSARWYDKHFAITTLGTISINKASNTLSEIGANGAIFNFGNGNIVSFTDTSTEPGYENEPELKIQGGNGLFGIKINGAGLWINKGNGYVLQS